MRMLWGSSVWKREQLELRPMVLAKVYLSFLFGPKNSGKPLNDQMRTLKNQTIHTFSGSVQLTISQISVL